MSARLDRVRIRNSSLAALSRAKLRSRISLARRVSGARHFAQGENETWKVVAMILGVANGPDIRREIRN